MNFTEADEIKGAKMRLRQIGFLSFAGGHLRWKFAKLRINRQIKKSRYFFPLEMYSEKKLSKIISPQIGELILDNRLGYGLWVWKPVILLDFLEKNPKCESILYLDAGCDFNSSNSSMSKWNEYLAYLENFDAIIFQNTLPEENYTSKKLVKKLESNMADVKSGQIEAGAFFMNRDFAIKFCREWLELMSIDNFDLLRHEKSGNAYEFYEGFIDYRYDQSVFSLMMKQRQNIKILQADRETDFFPWSAGLDFPILRSRNRSIVPVLKTRLIHRGLRKLERKVIKTYGKFYQRKLNRM